MTAPATQARGSNFLVTIGAEETYGTAVTSGTTFYCQSCSVTGGRALTAPPLLGNGLHPIQPQQGNYDVSGDLVIPFDLTTLTFLLPFMFPSNKFGSADVPSFSLAKHYPDLSANEFYVGCKFSTLKFSVGGTGDLVATFTVKGAATSATGPAKGTPAMPNLLQNGHATLAEGGSALAIGTQLDVAFDLTLDPDQFLIGGGFQRSRLDAGTVAATGNLKTIYTAGTLLAKGQAMTESSLALTFTKAAAVLSFTWPRLVYRPKNPSVSTGKGLLVDLAFEAYKALDDTTTNTTCTVVLPTA